jgi:hypothetical protein
VIAPLDSEVEQQLHALDRRRAQIARRYIRRLTLEPELGHGLTRALLATADCRAVCSDRSSRPDDLFGATRVAVRAGNEDPAADPAYRVVYRVLEARRTGVRVVQVLGVGRGHVAPGEESIYDTAARRLQPERRPR